MTDYFSKLTTNELVAYRNIYLFAVRFGNGDGFLGIIETILTERGIAFEAGKLLNKTTTAKQDHDAKHGK